MPKVLIISDSHGLTAELDSIKKRHEKETAAMIHCGDSELESDDNHLEGFYYAKGNCDFDPEMKDEQVVRVGELTIFATHGHLFQIKSTLMPLSYRAEEAGAQVACFGHSHMAAAEKVKDKLFINPGSCHLPRDRKEPTYAILEWESLAHVEVQFYHVTGEPIPELKMETSLTAKF
ncbi:metallophosphoesterase [Halobacillus salinarum]|uniref:Phosphoesterase n=1 Tax=Halobacillus salinarum TaxID=2932257 RepID=A0ABY4EQG0_9BACI|nr:metallophosphoesterase [Halobacillus salinarum]UOQ46220.1 metallophosphoesterase [Halobacillus salinarum]